MPLRAWLQVTSVGLFVLLGIGSVVPACGNQILGAKDGEGAIESEGAWEGEGFSEGSWEGEGGWEGEGAWEGEGYWEGEGAPEPPPDAGIDAASGTGGAPPDAGTGGHAGGP